MAQGCSREACVAIKDDESRDANPVTSRCATKRNRPKYRAAHSNLPCTAVPELHYDAPLCPEARLPGCQAFASGMLPVSQWRPGGCKPPSFGLCPGGRPPRPCVEPACCPVKSEKNATWWQGPAPVVVVFVSYQIFFLWLVGQSCPARQSQTALSTVRLGGAFAPASFGPSISPRGPSILKL